MSDSPELPFPPDPSLEGKRILITGAASGLGRATAVMAAGAGARVFCADIDEAGAVATAEEIGGYGMRTDVSSFEENLATVAAAEDALGGIDHAYLNAGVATGCGVGEDFDIELYRRANGANLDGVIFGTHAVLPALQRAGGGSIVATASLAGLTAVPFDPIYAANKHGVVGMVRSIGAGMAGENDPRQRDLPRLRREQDHRPDQGGAARRRASRSSRPRPSPRPCCACSPATSRASAGSSSPDASPRPSASGTCPARAERRPGLLRRPRSTPPAGGAGA